MTSREAVAIRERVRRIVERNQPSIRSAREYPPDVTWALGAMHDSNCDLDAIAESMVRDRVRRIAIARPRKQVKDHLNPGILDTRNAWDDLWFYVMQMRATAEELLCIAHGQKMCN